MGFKQRWMMGTVVALAAVTTTALDCNVTEPDSASTSDSTDDDGSKEAAAHQSCFEVALWCESLQTAVSPDPDNNCEYPCPDITS
ncbi:hypothetical protein PF004_g11800 [Phytophthora fragariae]|uniref:Secreted protein n=1 Tax=Phytophthora fragariae TaxID=53985 RepID=A0A6G0NWZ6_9STRA|nr:hypothetical protein PF004_g11800 [Phytophthora fragariae]